MTQAKELYVYPNQVKVDDTGTEVSFSLFQNGQPISVNKARLVFKNASGYVLQFEAVNGKFSTDVLKSLPPDLYEIEAWLAADDTSLIFPDIGFTKFEIIANVYTIQGQTLPNVSLKDFRQQIDDAIAKLHDAATPDLTGVVRSVDGLKPDERGSIILPKPRRYGPTGWTLDRSIIPWVARFDNGCTMINPEFPAVGTIMGYGIAGNMNNYFDKWPLPAQVIKVSRGYVNLATLIKEYQPAENWSASTIIGNPVNSINDFDWTLCNPQHYTGKMGANNQALYRDLYQLGALTGGDIQLVIDATKAPVN